MSSMQMSTHCNRVTCLISNWYHLSFGLKDSNYWSKDQHITGKPWSPCSWYINLIWNWPLTINSAEGFLSPKTDPSQNLTKNSLSDYKNTIKIKSVSFMSISLSYAIEFKLQGHFKFIWNLEYLGVKGDEILQCCSYKFVFTNGHLHF